MNEAQLEQLTKDERDLAGALILRGMPSQYSLSPKAFRDLIARTVIEAAEGVRDAGDPVSSITVMQFVTDSGLAEKYGSPRGTLSDVSFGNGNEELTDPIVSMLRDRVLKAHRDRTLADIEDKGRRNGDDSADIARAILAAEGSMESHHKPPFRDLLAQSAMNGRDFLALEIPDRPRLIGDWFRAADLGFIFAPRGVGKTWLAHMMLANLSAGRDLGEWEIPKPVRVCLLDGEMPPDAVQERLRRLEVNEGNLTVLSHQFLFDLSGRGFQIGDFEQRTALLDYCRTSAIDVLVIDNLSSVSNIAENDNDDWGVLGDWLLDFRRNGIAVVVVHHAGRNGQMRGASRREDPAFWIIKLDDSRERMATTDGARFVSTFTKNRNARQWPEPTDWHITTDENGTFTVATEKADNGALVLQAIRDDLDRCREIATELDLSPGTVSKIAKKLESEGKITISGKGNQARYNPN